MVATHLIASLKKPLVKVEKTLANLSIATNGLRVRADLCHELDPTVLRKSFSGLLVYALRDKSCGGSFQGTPEQRRRKLVEAAAVFDLIELDEALDLTPEMLDKIPTEKRLLAWRGEAQNPTQLRLHIRRMLAVPARYYLVAPEARRISEGMVPLRLLHDLKRSDVIAYASGASGTWTRPLSAYLGSPIVFGSLEDTPDEISTARLTRDFDLPNHKPISELFGVVGPDVSRSPSPRLHNAGYRALSRDALYLPFNATSFPEFRVDCLSTSAFSDLGLKLSGLTVVAPYKEQALAVATSLEEIAAISGGANILVRTEQGWYAGTSDPSGIRVPTKNMQLSGARAAVLGCGGAGRAAIAILKQAGARVTLVNHNQGRGRLAATLLSVGFMPLKRFSPKGFSLIVNATPMGAQGESPPFSLRQADPNTALLEYVLSEKSTPLISDAREQGMQVIDGWDVLCAQTSHQFQLLTGQELPPTIIPEFLDKRSMFQ